MTRRNPPIPRECHNCHNTKVIFGRNLCRPCYRRETYAGRIQQWPKLDKPGPPKGRPMPKRWNPNPLELGNPDHADWVLIERFKRGQPVRATHPDDRAAILQEANADDTVRNRALTALGCSGAIFRATLEHYQATQQAAA